MPRKRTSRLPSRLVAALWLALPAAWLVATVGVPDTAFADIASSKAIVDQAKARGIVGEQADGYLGLVSGSADAAVSAAVADINAGRMAVYRDTASKAGVTPAAAGEAAAKQIFSRLPAGQYYKPLNGGWTRK